jgi:hypothetical protein
LADFENCPQKYFRKYVLKDLPREKASAAMQHGIDTHNMMERAVKYGAPLAVGTPAIAQQYLDQLKPFKPQAEVKLAVDQFGDPVDFFSRAAVGRGKADILVVGETTGVIADWKTGKVREDVFELEVFGYLASRLLRHVKKWTGVYVWLKDEKVGKPHALDPVGAQRRISQIWQTIESCNLKENWPTNENPLCGWCPVKTCPFNRSEK